LNWPESTTTVAAITAPGGTSGTVSVLGRADAVSELLADDAVVSESELGNPDDPRTTSDRMSEPALFDDEVHPTVTASIAAVATGSIRRKCMDLLFIGHRRHRNRGKQ